MVTQDTLAAANIMYKTLGFRWLCEVFCPALAFATADRKVARNPQRFIHVTVSNNYKEMNEIDDIITNQLKLVEGKANRIEFDKVLEFKLNELHSLPQGILKYSGIYLFEIKRDIKIPYSKWIEDFTEKFRGKDNYFLHKFTPNIIESRKLKHSDNDEWIPLYLGKSKKIHERVEKHLFSALGISPFALKLKERKNLNDETFRLKTFKTNVKNYDVIVTHLEVTIRKKINPIVGKQ